MQLAIRGSAAALFRPAFRDCGNGRSCAVAGARDKPPTQCIFVDSNRHGARRHRYWGV